MDYHDHHGQRHDYPPHERAGEGDRRPPGRARGAVPGTRAPAHERRARDRRGRGRRRRLRCRAGGRRDLHGRARQRGLYLARPGGLLGSWPGLHRLDRPPRRGPAWPRSTPGGPLGGTSSLPWGRARSGRMPGWIRELFEKLGYEEEAEARRARARRPDASLPMRSPRLGGAEGAGKPAQLTFVNRAHGEPRGRRPDLRPDPGDGTAQDGDAGLRRRADRERHGHGADPASSPRTISGRSAAPTTPFCMAGRPTLRSRPATPSWRSGGRRCPHRRRRDYGTPFYDIFQRYDGDFYKIDPDAFSPGPGVAHQHKKSGRTFQAGHLNPEVLTASCYPS